jgi:UDP-N-acetylmuramoyl-L-alanyl-D-glutamate--2,6-diaminopimelate ligase
MRNEDPDVIIAEMELGVAAQDYKSSSDQADRRQAKTACQLAQPNDIIIIAGKGHETYRNQGN